MTVLTNGSPIVDSRGSVLSAFVPKPRPRTTQAAAEPARPRRSLRAWLRQHARQVKDGLVATAAFSCGSVAAFQWHPWAGWLSVGLSLIAVDHSIDRGEAVSDERAR